MSSLRKARRFTAGVVALLLLVGAVATNHCALAGLLSSAKVHSCCHEDDSQGAGQRSMQCCDALNAPIPESAVVPDCPVAQVPIEPVADLAEVVAVPLEPVVPAQSTGPPGGFYLSILLRTGCFRAHAPPLFSV